MKEKAKKIFTILYHPKAGWFVPLALVVFFLIVWIAIRLIWRANAKLE
ncbi:MAG: hypothetical protein IJ773_04685 [Lachnospiraceae bacterium]|nr:hypothetical protein [Lachnospiraceae bacterium]